MAIRQFVFWVVASSFFIGCGLLILDSPRANQRSCDRGKCATGYAVGVSLILVGLLGGGFGLKKVWGKPVPAHQTIPAGPSPLKPSKNPRYQRRDEFVTMADVPLDDPHYQRKQTEIARLRRELGYAEEIDILVYPEADVPVPEPVLVPKPVRQEHTKPYY